MKKLILCLLIALICFSGCKTEKLYEDSGKIKIVTTAFPIYDFAKNICGDNAEVSMLVPPGSDSHSFEPTPNDIITLIDSDLFIYIGGENEAWVSDILDSAGLDSDKTLSFENMIETDEEEHEDVHEHDEHIWTSVKNASEICNAITQKISSIDSVNAAQYNNNFSEYNKKLIELDEKFTEIVENALRKTVVFGDRFPFLYFVKDYDLEYFSAFPGCAAETEPSAATVAELTDKIKSENIPVVFHIEFSNENVADILCEATGAEKMLFHSCHNVTQQQITAGIGYIELMTKNAENLKEALN